MMLSYETVGDGPAHPLLIVHGLYGSARNWRVIAKRLGARGPVSSVDMRNHGRSAWHESHSYEDLATDLAEVIEALGAPMDVVGHSMGGKSAMVLAATRPELVRRLIVADIAPVSYAHDQTQHIRAMRAVDLSTITRRSDAAAALAAQGVSPALQAFFTQSLDVPGRCWRLNLDVLAREMPKILGFPALSGQFDGPVLMLAGAESDYVLPAHRPAIRALFPKARFAKLKNAGHWLHSEQPHAFEMAVRLFLDGA